MYNMLDAHPCLKFLGKATDRFNCYTCRHFGEVGTGPYCFSDIISKALMSSPALSHIHIQWKLLFQRKMLRRGHIIWWNILFQQSWQPWWDLDPLQCLFSSHWFLLSIFSEEKSLEAMTKTKNYSLLQIEEGTACYLRPQTKILLQRRPWFIG